MIKNPGVRRPVLVVDFAINKTLPAQPGDKGNFFQSVSRDLVSLTERPQGEWRRGEVEEGNSLGRHEPGLRYGAHLGPHTHKGPFRHTLTYAAGTKHFCFKTWEGGKVWIQKEP